MTNDLIIMCLVNVVVTVFWVLLLPRGVGTVVAIITAVIVPIAFSVALWPPQDRTAYNILTMWFTREAILMLCIPWILCLISGGSVIAVSRWIRRSTSNHRLDLLANRHMKARLLIISFTSFAIGCALGIGFQRWQQRAVDDLVSKIPLTHTSANAARCVSVLKLLRAGDTDGAATRLEVYLDGDLIGLGPAYQAATPEQRNASWAARTIQTVREYRQAHPHTPDPAIATAVAETLSIPTP